MIPEIDPTILDVLGHIGYIFLASGMILLARKSIWGWVCRGIGEFMWLFIGIAMGMSSIWFWGIVFCCVEVYGFRSWKRSTSQLS